MTDWHNGQFGYDYDNANRLAGLTLPNGVESGYTYDETGRLELLTHQSPITQSPLSAYEYTLDNVGNRRTLAETLLTIRDLPAGAYLETEGQVVLEAEHFGRRTNGPTHQWNLPTTQSGYTGTSYLHPSLDIDTLYQTSEITASPVAEYAVNVTTPGTYTVWLRGYPTNAAGDSVYLDLVGQVLTVTGFAPYTWTWASEATPVVVTSTGVSTLSLWMREDGLRIDRFLITTDTTYIPTDYGPAETERQLGGDDLIIPLTHTIAYTYDNLYRLTNADYSTGESYAYEYDPVGNRLQQIIDGDTTEYQYDAANRLTQIVNPQSSIVNPYTFDANGNLLTSGVMTNTWDAANRLIETQHLTTTLQPIYNGVGDRVGQTVEALTTHFALDVQGLPEVIYTSEGEVYLHLPGVIMTESAEGEVRYLLSDGLGSIRQAVDDTGAVISYHEFDPYGNPVPSGNEGGEPYGYTGEWWEEVGLLHLRARWYAPYEGVFLSRDPVESEPAYQYVRGNPVSQIDPSGMTPPWPECLPPLGSDDWPSPGCEPPQPPAECFQRAPGDILPPYCYNYPPDLLPPYQQLPTPPPFIQGVKGFVDVVDAIVSSKLNQGDDGIIFGFAGEMASLLAHAGVNSPEQIKLWTLAFNNVCLPSTGGTRGFEVVYDFKHQERGIFTYSGGVFNIGSISNVGGVAYTGKTRGFANPENTYDIGVYAYAGYFASGTLSVGLPILGPISLAGAYIEAAPLNNDKTLNRTGVFATYYGVGIGGSVGPPVNGDLAVTFYEPVGREQYMQATLRASKRDTYQRTVTAGYMMNEIIYLSALTPGGIPQFGRAMTELWDFVDNP